MKGAPVAVTDPEVGARPELDAPPPLPPPLRRRRPGQTSLLMALAAVIVALATYAALRDRDVTYRVLYAADDLRAGTTLSAQQFDVADISIDPRRLEQLVSADSADSMAGYVAANDLAAGDLVTRSDLREPAAPVGLRAMSVPVDAVNAVAGDLRPGDRVDVIRVGDTTVSYLATDLDLLSIGGTADTTGIAAGATFSVTLAVDDAVALELARAVEREAVHIVRSTGADPADADALDAPPPTDAAPVGDDADAQPFGGPIPPPPADPAEDAGDG